VPTGNGDDAGRLALSDRLRSRELFAFIEIDPETLHPSVNQHRSIIRYYSNENGADNTVERWMADAVNEGLRRARLAQLGVDKAYFGDMLSDVPLVNMTPVTRDSATGAIASPRPKDPATTFIVPYLLVMLLFFVTLMGSVTMLPAVAEDKLQRVFEMLLVSATPLELMAGKALAAVGRALTGSAVFVIGGLLALQGAAMVGLVPFPLLPWFFTYVIAEAVILSALAIALGAACGSPQDAQSLNQILILPVVIPLVLMVPILQQPNRAMATILSLFPPFTPTLMLVRQATPGGVPVWQPWVGLLGVLVYGVVVTWAASRIFRVAILFQGTAPKLPELFRWAVRG
jgi:ABC-2 type transport system permease protein